MNTLRPEDVPDEWVRLAVRANADRNHDNLCGCITWPEKCATGYTPDQWEHGDEAHTITAVLPEIEKRVREQSATASAILHPADLAELLDYVAGRGDVRVVQDETLARAFTALKATVRSET